MKSFISKASKSLMLSQAPGFAICLSVPHLSIPHPTLTLAISAAFSPSLEPVQHVFLRRPGILCLPVSAFEVETLLVNLCLSCPTCPTYLHESETISTSWLGASKLVEVLQLDPRALLISSLNRVVLLSPIASLVHVRQ